MIANCERQPLLSWSSQFACSVLMFVKYKNKPIGNTQNLAWSQMTNYGLILP